MPHHCFFLLKYTKQLYVHTKSQCHAVSCTSVLIISFVLCFLWSVRGVGIFYRQQNGRLQGMCNCRTISKNDVDSQTVIHTDSSIARFLSERGVRNHNCPHKEKPHGARTSHLGDQEHQMPYWVLCRTCCTVFFRCSSCSG